MGERVYGRERALWHVLSWRNVLFLLHTFALAAQNYFVAYFRAACTNAACSPLALHGLRLYFFVAYFCAACRKLKELCMDAGTLRVSQAEIRENQRIKAEKQVQESEREYIKERREYEIFGNASKGCVRAWRIY